jgi:hypothetical protein
MVKSVHDCVEAHPIIVVPSSADEDGEDHSATNTIAMTQYPSGTITPRVM